MSSQEDPERHTATFEIYCTSSSGFTPKDPVYSSGRTSRSGSFLSGRSRLGSLESVLNRVVVHVKEDASKGLPATKNLIYGIIFAFGGIGLSSSLCSVFANEFQVRPLIATNVGNVILLGGGFIFIPFAMIGTFLSRGSVAPFKLSGKEVTLAILHGMIAAPSNFLGLLSQTLMDPAAAIVIRGAMTMFIGAVISAIRNKAMPEQVMALLLTTLILTTAAFRTEPVGEVGSSASTPGNFMLGILCVFGSSFCSAMRGFAAELVFYVGSDSKDEQNDKQNSKVSSPFAIVAAYMSRCVSKCCCSKDMKKNKTWQGAVVAAYVSWCMSTLCILIPMFVEYSNELSEFLSCSFGELLVGALQGVAATSSIAMRRLVSQVLASVLLANQPLIVYVVVCIRTPSELRMQEMVLAAAISIITCLYTMVPIWSERGVRVRQQIDVEHFAETVLAFKKEKKLKEAEEKRKAQEAVEKKLKEAEEKRKAQEAVENDTTV